MRKSILFGCIAVVFSVALLLTGSIPTVDVGSWGNGDNLAEAREDAAAAQLPDGSVLVTGGRTAEGALASVEFIETDGSVSSGPAMSAARYGHTATTLSDGRVLVAGGFDSEGTALASAEIYDPGTDSWSPAVDLNEARGGHTATALPNGGVIVTGGQGATGPLASYEIFNETENNFVYLRSMNVPRADHAAALLDGDRILVTGGNDGNGPLSSSEIINYVSLTSTNGPAMGTPRSNHTATTLISGLVLVAGGNDGENNLASAEVYDPDLDQFAALPVSMSSARSGHMAIRLADNNSVLLLDGGSATSEIFRSWDVAFASFAQPSDQHAGGAYAPLTEEGFVVVAGGNGVSSTDIYHFATLYTDKDDYAPGETVNVFGSGWQPGEQVQLLFTEDSTTHQHTFYATADSNGDIDDLSFTPTEEHRGENFTLTATDSISQASIRFSDAPNSVTLTPATVTLDPNGTQLFTANVKNGSTNQVGVQVNWTLASGSGTLDPGCNGVTDASGNKTCLYTAPASGGSATIEAEEQVDDRDDSSAITIKHPTTLTLTTPVIQTQGVNASLTATLATVPGGAASVNNKNVSFFVDGAEQLAVTNTNNAGLVTKTIATGALSVGSHTLQAVFNGDSTLMASSSVVGELIIQAEAEPTTTTITPPAAITFGQDASVTVTVTANEGTPTGDVQLTSPNGSTINVTQALVSGSTTFTISGLNAATYNLTALYIPSGDFMTSNDTDSLLVNRASQTIDFTDPADVIFGAADFGLVATSTSGDAVTFSVPNNSALSLSGTNNATAHVEKAGTVTITAEVAQSTNYNSASTTQSVTVNKATPVFSGLSSKTIGYGTSPTNFAGVLSYNGHFPSGSVTVTIQGDGSGSDNLDNAGAFDRNITTTNLAVGQYTVTYSYGGDDNFNAVEDTSTTITVEPAATTTTIDAPTIEFGEDGEVTVTLDAASTNNDVTGEVSLVVDGGAPLVQTLTAQEEAVFILEDLTIGTHTLLATYAAQGNFAGSSAEGTIEVTKIPAKFSQLSQPHIRYGDTPTTLSGTISGKVLIPVGSTVTISLFKGEDLGTETHDATVDEAGFFSADFETGEIPVEHPFPYTITYSFTGDEIFEDVIDDSKELHVQKAQTEFRNTVSSTEIYGTETTELSGEVFATTQQLTEIYPPGNVDITINGFTISTPVSAEDGSFSADFPIYEAGLQVANGPYTITYEYPGNESPNFTGANDTTQTATVTIASTTTTLESSKNPQALGVSVTFTATVLGEVGNDVDEGTVTFYDNGAELATVNVEDGTASYSTDALAEGSHPITATYNPTTNYTGSSSDTLTQWIVHYNTALRNLSSPTIQYGTPNTVISGEAYAPDPVLGGDAEVYPVGDIVAITLNGVTQNATVQANGSFSSSFATGSLDVPNSSYTIDFSFDGAQDPFFKGTTGQSTLTVEKADTSVTVLSSLNPAPPGVSFTLTATVTSDVTSGAVTVGTVTFYIGDTEIQAATAVDGNGQVTFSADDFAIGEYHITAVYSGDTNYNGSEGSIDQEIAKFSPVFSNLSAPTIIEGTPSTAISGKLADGTHIPEGETVEITIDGVTEEATVAADGTFSVNFDTSALTVDDSPYVITFDFAGSTFFDPATSVSTLIVNPGDYELSISPSSATVTRGQSATFVITVTPNPAPYIHEIDFSCGPLPEEVTCSFSPSSVTPGFDTEQVTLTVRTTAPSLAQAPPATTGVLWAMAIAPTFGIGLFGLVIAMPGAGPKSKRKAQLMLFICLAMILLMLPACGGGGGRGGSDFGSRVDEGTPTGTFTIRVNANAGDDSHPINFTLTVR